jgi:hypothetical protein
MALLLIGAGDCLAHTINRTVNHMAGPKRILFLAALIFSMASLPGDAWSHSRSASGRHWSGAKPGSAHHHHHRRHFHGGFFVGGPLFYPWPHTYYPGPYYYAPDYVARSEPPTVYVEKFDGTPTPQTTGEIYCPSLGAHYPVVQDCPGGWQRIFRP